MAEGCLAHCPSHAYVWTSGNISLGTVITYQHFQEIKDALHAERKRRYVSPNIANYTYPEQIASSLIITKQTITKFKDYIDELRAYHGGSSASTHTVNQTFLWNYINYYTDSNQEIMANSMLELRTKINDLNNDCVCDCNYCACNCNYCTCNCNYCTCNCNYACTCNCNYCTCNCNYCQCQCSFFTCPTQGSGS